MGRRGGVFCPVQRGGGARGPPPWAATRAAPRVDAPSLARVPPAPPIEDPPLPPVTLPPVPPAPPPPELLQATAKRNGTDARARTRRGIVCMGASSARLTCPPGRQMYFSCLSTM